MPTIRVEVGYLTSPVDRVRLVDPLFRDTVAEGILVAVQRLYLDYKGSDSLVGPDGVTHINPHLHNDFLQYAAELGLVGGLAFIALLVALVMSAVEHLEGLPDAWGVIGNIAGNTGCLIWSTAPFTIFRRSLCSWHVDLAQSFWPRNGVLPLPWLLRAGSPRG